MLIDWTHFTPWSALAGGVLLGLASALFVLLHGRILGISGIVGGLLRPKAGDTGWRLAFVLGMLVAPGLYWLFAGATAPRIDAGWGAVVAAGSGAGLAQAAKVSAAIAKRTGAQARAKRVIDFLRLSERGSISVVKCVRALRSRREDRHREVLRAGHPIY